MEFVANAARSLYEMRFTGGLVVTGGGGCLSLKTRHHAPVVPGTVGCVIKPSF
ncbi:hypothetical protein [Pararhodospirillum oryzae]|uniref:hypothetical protein n=1 Tax=Pararhodospirillum oryzae TaxID=478448 RepID=UPI0014780BD6|nr:hypothetical protein [Pararhodospirillum oryzae]